MLRYNSYRSYLKNRFGGPVLKIPVNGGFSCPNRDGTKSADGCTFCDNRSFSPVAICKEDVVRQVTDVIARAGKRFTRFIPYLQPFSNTYGSVEKLRSVYEPLLEIPGVCGLAIGTRPDCFSEEIYEYLEEISKRTYLSVELGLQSSDNTVLTAHNRGHSVEDFAIAVEKLAGQGIQAVAHCMIGLPGETEEKMVATATFCAQLPLHGVKIHQLMIISGTALERMYNAGELSVFSLQEYTQHLCSFLSILKPQQYIHRLMADSTPQNGLLAPLWSAQKTESLQFIAKYMDDHNVVQGSTWLEKQKSSGL